MKAWRGFRLPEQEADHNHPAYQTIDGNMVLAILVCGGNNSSNEI
jgi:hypothetical protein